ncbi:MAG TPA: Maf family protein [Nitrospiraceae bacterium]|nr:Maf family protein [Nitrospiraceae bacterium]
MRVVLASTSPRRRELLSLLRISFEVVEPAFTEQIRSDLSPHEQACLFAEGKAQSCRLRFPDRLIIGSDTLIELNGKILGKPSNAAHAESMLKQLRGHEHMIQTAVAIVDSKIGSHKTAIETVRVWFKPLSDDAVTRYVATGESMGKAGAYAIQGAGGDLIERIDGDYTAAVGLPLRRVAMMLQEEGVTIPISIDTLYRAHAYPNWSRFAK